MYWPIIEQSELMLNAGVDINGFKPVTFDELVENNVNHKIKTASHRMYVKTSVYFQWPRI